MSKGTATPHRADEFNALFFTSLAILEFLLFLWCQLCFPLRQFMLILNNMYRAPSIESVPPDNARAYSVHAISISSQSLQQVQDREDVLTAAHTWSLGSDHQQGFEPIDSIPEILPHPAAFAEDPLMTPEIHSNDHSASVQWKTFAPEPQVEPVDTVDNEYAKPERAGLDPYILENPWKTGFWRRFPVAGILCLMISITCTGAAITILMYSNGKSVTNPLVSGNRQPTVLIAYTSTLANACMSAALMEAILVSFWRRVLQGTTIPELHAHWASGQGVWDAVKAVGRWRTVTVSIASLLVTLTALLRGPLVQRTIFTQVVSSTVNGTISLLVSSDMNDYFGGINPGRASGTLYYRPSFSNVTRDFQNKASMSLPASSSCDNCSMTIESFGFGVDCTTVRTPFNFTLPVELGVNTTSLPWQRLSNGSAIFQTSLTTIPLQGDISNGALSITSLRKVDSGCEGNMENRTCILQPGTSMVDIAFNGGNVTLRSPSWTNDTFVKGIPMFYRARSQEASTLIPLYDFGNNSYASNSDLAWAYASGWVLSNKGLFSNIYIRFEPDGNETTCNGISFADPMDDIINAYRELAFRMSLQLAKDNGTTAIAQTVPYASQAVQIQYAINTTSLVIAVLISLAGPLAILPLFWGWWVLGRKVSLSPIETANAFFAGDNVVGSNVSQQSGPLLSHEATPAGNLFAFCSGNATAGQIVKALGPKGDFSGPRLRYAVLQSGRLGLGYNARKQK
jgi:hypothetical protein